MFSKFLAWLKKPQVNEVIKTVIKVLIGAGLGTGGTMCLTGCSAMTPQTKAQGMEVYAFGIPAIAIIKSSQQTADNSGSDANTPQQSNPVTVEPVFFK